MEEDNSTYILVVKCVKQKTEDLNRVTMSGQR